MKFFLKNFAYALKVKSFAINPYCDVNDFNRKMIDQIVTSAQFTKFLKTLIGLWLKQDDKNLQIREIDDFIGATIEEPVFCACNFNALCWTSFCLNYDGKIYLCDSVLGEKEFLIGDLSKQSLWEIFQSSRWQEMVQNINTLSDECKSCKWQSLCKNGCPTQRVGGIKGKYYYCETRKEIFEYLTREISGILNEKKKGGEKNETKQNNNKRG